MTALLARLVFLLLRKKTTIACNRNRQGRYPSTSPFGSQHLPVPLHMNYAPDIIMPARAVDLERARCSAYWGEAVGAAELLTGAAGC